MGGKSLGSVIVIFMFILQSWAASVHAPADGSAEVLEASNDTAEVIPAPSVLNAPGFHEGTVFSEATLAAGGFTHAPSLMTAPFPVGVMMKTGNSVTAWIPSQSLSPIRFFSASMLQPTLQR